VPHNLIHSKETLSLLQCLKENQKTSSSLLYVFFLLILSLYCFFFFSFIHNKNVFYCYIIVSVLKQWQQLFHHQRSLFQRLWPVLEDLRMLRCTLAILKGTSMRLNFMTCSVRLPLWFLLGFAEIRWCSLLLVTVMSTSPTLVMVCISIFILSLCVFCIRSFDYNIFFSFFSLFEGGSCILVDGMHCDCVNT